MLVLSRQKDESIMIGDNVEITIVDVRGDKVRLGINAPKEIPVHRREVFEWQLSSSKIIFYVVIFLVLIGVFFSGVQFYAAHKKNFMDDKVTEISASAKGIKVSSSVLGVIILIISLMFFYLYLVYVYPINEIF